MASTTPTLGGDTTLSGMVPSGSASSNPSLLPASIRHPFFTSKNGFICSTDKDTCEKMNTATANATSAGSSAYETSQTSSTASSSTASTPAFYIYCLPTEGKPYIRHTLSKKDDTLKPLQETVQGYIQPYGRPIIIHPIFLENEHWDFARQLLKVKSVKVYVNEEGAYKCSPNVATIIGNGAGGCPHLFGDVALLVPAKVLDVMGKKVSDLRTTPDDEEDDDEDDEENEEDYK